MGQHSTSNKCFTENNVTFACRQSPVQANIQKTISLTFVGQLLAHEDDGTVNQHTEPVNVNECTDPLYKGIF